MTPAAAPAPFVVGLTGGIGSGKSTVADYFAALGAPVVDTDALAHALTAPGGAAIAAIRTAFGPALITAEGALDRAAMRQRVFAAPAERQRLEAILHPLIHTAAVAQIRRLASADFSPPYLVLVVPLLVETGRYRDQVGRIAVVDCPEDLQITRAMARSALSRAEVAAIIAAQASRATRRAAADDLIDNTAGRDALQARVAALHAQYLDMGRDAGKRPPGTGISA
jgi:dephospho-CoA kinase